MHISIFGSIFTVFIEIPTDFRWKTQSHKLFHTSDRHPEIDTRSVMDPVSVGFANTKWVSGRKKKHSVVPVISESCITVIIWSKSDGNCKKKNQTKSDLVLFGWASHNKAPGWA